MINVSNEFHNAVTQDRKFLMKADLTLADLTAIPLKNSDIMQSGMSFEDAVSGNGDFQVGAAIIGKHVLTLSNRRGQFNDYDFGGATVIPYVGLQLSSAVEYVRKGFFTVDEAIFNGNIVTLECLDNMHKFEKPFSGVTQVFPCTYGDLLYSVCLHCGVILGTVVFTDSDKIIQSRPDDNALSCLDVVSLIAQNTGNFARCNVDGALELKWYDTSVFEQPNLDGGTFDSSEYYEKDGESSQAVTVQGKNICSRFIPQTINGITANVASDGTITLNGTATANAFIYVKNNINFMSVSGNYAMSINNNKVISGVVYVFARRDETTDMLSLNCSVVNNKGTVNITTPFTANRHYIYVASGTVVDNLVLKPQLEIGTVATAYEPFSPNSPTPEYQSPITTNLPAGTYKYTYGNDIYEFSIANDLCGIGSIRDKIVFDKVNHRGYVEKKYKKYVCTGLETGWSKHPSINDLFMLSSTITNAKVTTDNICMSSHFKTYPYYPNVEGISMGGTTSPNRILIKYRAFNNNLAGFKSWLTSNNVTVIYEMSTPTRTELTFTKVSSSSAPEIDASLVTDLSTLPYVYPYTSGDNADGGNFEDYNSGDAYDGGGFDDFKKYHHFYFHHTQPSLHIDDVVVTGVKVEINNIETPLTAFFGTEGYVISIVNNPLIQSQEDADRVAATVGAKIIGMRFRPFSANVLSNPCVEAGDACYLTVRTNQGWQSYQSYITSLSYKVNSQMPIRCDAKTASRNSATRYSEATKTYADARKTTEKKLTDYDLLVQQMTTLICGGYGMFQTQVTDEGGGTIYYMHDKPSMDESAVRWFVTSEGMIEQNRVGGVWVTVSGTDKQGNALYNTLTARKISADILRTGKIYSDDGSTLIDMAYGVANSDNISFSDNIQSGFPLSMPFNIDDSVSKINKVQLKFTQQKFRTSSTVASSGGETSTSSSTAATLVTMSTFGNNAFTNYEGYGSSATGSTTAEPGIAHSHSYTEHDHRHSFNYSHSHVIYDEGHSHTVDIPSHVHGLNFGIQETPISDNTIQIYVDGTLLATSTDLQGIIDLTAYVTTVGWHTIEIRSTVLKRVSAQIIIKSYIRS